MKIVGKFVALGVLVAAPLLCSAPGWAQTPDVIGLQAEGNVTNLTAGETINIDGWVTPGIDSSGNTAHITTIQAALIFNPSIFDVTSVTVSNSQLNPQYFTTQSSTAGTFTIPNKPSSAANGSWGGVVYTGTRDRTATPLPANAVFATYTLTVKGTADIQSYLGSNTALFYSNDTTAWNVTDADLISSNSSTNPSRTFRTSVLTASAQRLSLSLGSAPLIFHVGPLTAVPGPSSLLVFAMGAVPALRVFRSRRRARATA